jgi:hypothetical protein
VHAAVCAEASTTTAGSTKAKHKVGYMRKRGSMYVAQSRVTTSDGLFMSSIVDSRLEAYEPPRDVLMLLQRMFRLELKIVNDAAFAGSQDDALRAFVAESEEHAQRVAVLLAGRAATGKGMKRKAVAGTKPPGRKTKRTKVTAASNANKKRKRADAADSNTSSTSRKRHRANPPPASGSTRQSAITDNELATLAEGIDGYEPDTVKFYDANFRNTRRWLDDRIVNHACALLHAQAIGPVYGLQDTLLLSHNAANMNVQANQGPQILHMRNNHWMVVLGGKSSRRVYVYDTLPSGRGVDADVKALCARLYDRADLVFEIVPIQRQRGGNDCGLFAIAIVEAIQRRIDITTITFDQALMRAHLSACFAANALSPFPLLQGN